MAKAEATKGYELVASRFMSLVTKEFTGKSGDLALTRFQRRLANNYLIAVDRVLIEAEKKRRTRRGADPLPVVWENVDMHELALDVVSAARIGLDPAQPNHIHMIPFKNNHTEQYNIVFMEGYRGLELKATKYGLDVPDSVVVELVYSNDRFKPIKKDFRNEVESYEFEIENPFNRGEIVGGFYYHSYTDEPRKNILMVYTLEEILKRKPVYASVEFWGGEKPVWRDGKRVGTEQVEGWFKEMCWKTIYRAAYKNITIDSQKIDDDYMRLLQREAAYLDQEIETTAEETISSHANKDVIDVDFVELEDEKPVTGKPEGKKLAEKQAEEPKQGPKATAKPVNKRDPGF